MNWLKKQYFRMKRKVIRFIYKPKRYVEKQQSPFKGKIRSIVFIVGHKSIAPGAKGVSGLHEFFYWKEVIKLIRSSTVKINFVDREGTSITGAVMRAAKFNPDLIIELHFNAFNKKAHGTTVRYATPSAKIAEDWCAFTAKKLGRRNRKGRNIRDVSRGVTNVEVAQAIAPQAFLIEPFFGDNSKDYVTVLEMADCLNEYITQL